MAKAKRERLKVERVKELLAAGMTDRQVAVATGHFANHVKVFRRRHGLECNPEERCKKLNIDAVKALVSEGWAGTKIAKAFGAEKTSVYDLMERHGIKPAHAGGRGRKRGKK